MLQEIIQAIADPFWSGVFTILAAVVIYFLQPRAKLRWGTIHTYNYGLPTEPDNPQSPKVHISAKSTMIVNNGRGIADGVEVVLDSTPHYFSVWNQRSYHTSTNAEDRFIIHLGNLLSKEWVQVHVIHVGQAPDTIAVRAQNAQGKWVNIIYSLAWPKWLIRLQLVVLLIGAAYILYLGLLLLELVVTGVMAPSAG